AYRVLPGSEAPFRIREQYRRITEANPPEMNVSVDDLLDLCASGGDDWRKWVFTRSTAALALADIPTMIATRKPIKADTYDVDVAIVMVSEYYVVEDGEDTGSIFRILDTGKPVMVPDTKFKLQLANVTVKKPVIDPNGHRAGFKAVPVSKEWKESVLRNDKKFGFWPDGEPREGCLNLYMGYAIKPEMGDKHLSFLRHVKEVMCGGDEDVYWYFDMWAKRMFRFPWLKGETAPFSYGPERGSGKSLPFDAWRHIWGNVNAAAGTREGHGFLFLKKDQLIGKHAAHLYTTIFGQCDEVLWSGDMETLDTLKGYQTSGTLGIEPKFLSTRQVINYLHLAYTSNHELPIKLMGGERRWLVKRIDPAYREKLDDGSVNPANAKWFKPIIDDLYRDGGLANLLRY